MGAPCGLLSTEREKDRCGAVNDEGSNRLLAAEESQGISQFAESSMHLVVERSYAGTRATRARMTGQQASATTSEIGHGRFRVAAELVCFVTIYTGRRPVTPSELHFMLAF